jgi:hypothetical protein
MKTLLLLTFAAVSMQAARIEYVLTNGSRDILSFVTAGYLPSAQPPDANNPSVLTWTLPESKLATSPCPNPPAHGSTCRVVVQLFNGDGYPNPQVHLAAIVRRIDGEEYNLLMGIGSFNLHDLDHDADVHNGPVHFIIRPTDHAATVTPEPKPAILLFGSLCLACCYVLLKQRFQWWSWQSGISQVGISSHKESGEQE